MAVNELQIARNAHCTNLIQFIDAYFNDGKISIVMEFAGVLLALISTLKHNTHLNTHRARRH